MSVRTRVIDELIQQLLVSRIDLVLNLAAGLDTRPYRMILSPDLHWIEADLPALTAFKNERLAGEKPSCRLERRQIDLAQDEARRSLIGEVGDEALKGLVITEGLLGYLTVENVAALARELHAQDSLEWWIMDFMDRRVTEWMREQLAPRMITGETTTLRFMPGNHQVDFLRSFGWEPVARKNFLDEGKRLNRPPPASWPADVVEALGRSGIALLKRV
jgi:methyltransferase (TIGR00027 family)